MSPVVHAEEELLLEKKEQQKPPERGPIPPQKVQPVVSSLHSTALFAEALLEMSPTYPRRRGVDLFLSVVLHFCFITILLLLPLYFTEAIDLREFTRTLLVAPPPPPPPPPPPTPAVMARILPKRVFTNSGKLLAPNAIPQKVAMLKEEPLEPDIVGVTGGVPGGVPGGQAGGVIGGIIADSRTFIPARPVSAPRPPIRVGGRVSAPRPISTPLPEYPPLARQAKIQGTVVIDAVIDAQGNVVEMKVVSGHPLLIHAALATVAKWKYQPTILNEEPVAVQLLVTVVFRLE